MYRDLTKRIMALALSVCMIAGMVDLSGLTVRAAENKIRNADVTLSQDTFTYNGSAQKPTLTITDYFGESLVEGEDYRLEWGECTNAGTSSVTVINRSDSTDTQTVEFYIDKKDIEDCTFSGILEQWVPKDDAKAEPSVTVTDIDNQLRQELLGTTSTINTDGMDYTYRYLNNIGPGTGIVEITGVNNYDGKKEIPFTISKLNAESLTFEFKLALEGRGMPYDEGRVVEAEIKEGSVKYGSDELLEKEYEVCYDKQRYAGLAEVWIKGKGAKYDGLESPHKTYKITKNIGKIYTNSRVNIQVDIVEEKPYAGGDEVELDENDLVLRDPDYEGKQLKRGEDGDYVILSYHNNRNQGTATVTIEGRGCYTGRRTEEFKIVAAQLEAGMVKTTGETYMYDGSDQFSKVEQAIVVSNGNVTYERGPNKDYTVSAVPGDAGTSAGKHKVRVTPTGRGRLIGDSVDVEYEVLPRPLKDPWIHISVEDYTDREYNGDPKRPGVHITFEPQGGGVAQDLIAGVDYEEPLSYTNNTNATTSTSKAHVRAVGKGNFTGESDWCDFEIDPIRLTNQNTTITGIQEEPYVYSGSDIEPNVTVVYGGENLRKGIHYTVSYENNLHAGVTNGAKIKISGMGNYRGEFTESFTITQRDLSNGVNIQVSPSMTYTGQKLRPTVTVKHGTNTLYEGSDYTIEYGDNIHVSDEGSVTLTGCKDYKGTVTRTFAITPRSITDGTLGIKDINQQYDFTTGTPDEHYYFYTGGEVTFPLAVSFTNEKAEMNDVALNPGTDYELDFTRNIGPGTAQVIIRAKGDYTGSKPVTFTIKGNLSDYGKQDAFTTVDIPEQVYTSNPIVPNDVAVTFAGKNLTSRDYEIVCENNDNTNAGIATARIVGKNDYCGAAESVPFTIRKLNLSTDSLQDNKYVINMKDKFTFCDTNLPIHPEPEITHNGNTLYNDVHYYLSYGDNNEVGKGTLVIRGNDVNYEGRQEIEFDIEKYDIAKGEAEGYIDVQGIYDVVLDKVLAGEDVNAEIKENDKTVVMSDLKLEYTPVDLAGEPMTGAIRDLDFGTEYTVQYRDNRKIGTATITIQGIGNFGGEIVKTFKIRGDLSSARTSLSVDDCTYTPAGNTPEPQVTYTYDNGTKEILQAGIDYEVTYSNNTDSTVKSGMKAQVIISPVYEEDGKTLKGDYAQTSGMAKAAEFEIFQRDLTNAIETEGKEKDPSLNVAGLAEEGYDYTGAEILPDLQITCDEMGLTVGDYEISAVNNTNVYTFGEESNGGRVRLHPTVMVSAMQNGDGEYTGNYKGGFQMEFKINPRQISADTIKTLLWISGESNDDTQVPELDYTGEEIRFPVDFTDPLNTKNDITVTWNKQEQSVVLEEDRDYKVIYEDNTRIGEAKVIISAVDESNYVGDYTRNFKIMASIEVVDDPNPPLRYITLNYDHNVPYGIVDVYPEMTFTDTSGGQNEEPKILQLGEDFEIVTEQNVGTLTDKGVSKNNKNVAGEDLPEEQRPTVVIRGIGCYRGTIKRYYNIIPKNLATDDGDITIEFEGALNTENYENAFIYTGKAIEPKVKVYNHGQLMTDLDYTVAGYQNNTAISTDTLKASVVIRAVSGGNYTGEKTFYYNIIKHPIDEMTVAITSGDQVYSRTQKKPEVEVSYVENSQRKVLDKSNYDVAYENNINAATEFAGESAPTIVITGKGSYGGTIRKTFTIAQESLDESNDDFVITSENVYYTGLDTTTEITVKAKDGTLLEEEKDYVITGYKNNKNAGTAYVTIRGNGNYTGTRDVPFQIIAPDVSDRFLISDIADQVYTGSPIEPQVSVAVAEGESEIRLTSDEYELDYENNINVGTASVIVRGTGNYGGAKRVTFKITPKSIGAEGSMAADIRLAEIGDQLYTGRGVTPEVSLTRRGQTGQADEPLVLGKDYTLSYLTNVAVGTASVNIIGIGNYTGNIQTKFRIIGPMNLADVAKINVQPYTGSAVTPEPNVSYAGKKLTKGEDYTLVYADNVTQGTAKITITGQGMYTGEKIVTFEIARDFSNETIVKGMAAAYTYTGKAITPTVLVEDHGRILSSGTDFKVSYSNNVNVGTATVTVTGMGAYSGTVSAQFKITPQNIGRAAVSKVADQTYDGKTKKPSVSVSSDGIVLKSGTDYTVVHVDNKNPGKASVIIKGKGNFTGTQTVNYNIIVPKVTGVKVSSYTDTTITFSWKRNKVVTGYEIYNSKNKRVARVKKNSTLQATVSKLKAGTTETFRVRAYVTRGQYYYSDFVSIKAGTAPKATKITSITSSKSNQVALKWKKVTGATQYQVYRSTSKNGKYKKIATTKKTSYTDKKATGGKTYYYKICVGKKNGSKTYYSYSKVKSVAAKK